MKIKIKDVFEKDEKDIHVQTNERLDIDEIFEDAREERQEMSLEEEKNDATGISDMSVQDSSEEPAVNAGVVEASDDAEQVEPSQDAAEAGPEEVTAAETPDQQEKPGDETCEPAGEQADSRRQRQPLKQQSLPKSLRAPSSPQILRLKKPHCLKHRQIRTCS